MSLSSSSAGTIAEPAGEIPSASKAQAIVLAVNWPPQAPAPGLATVLHLEQFLIGHLAGGVGADRLEHVDDGDVLAVQRPGAIEPP